jgi:hypothetical protein
MQGIGIKRIAPGACEGDASISPKRQELELGEQDPGAIRPLPPPREPWFLAIKLEDCDALGCPREGHAQIFTRREYFGMSLNGMHDPQAMRYPHIVLEGTMDEAGIAAMKNAEAELIREAAPYDRAGKAGINCLMAAAKILAAVTGAPLEKAFAPEGKMNEFSIGIQEALIDADVPFFLYKKEDAIECAREWRKVPDKGFPKQPAQAH